MSFDEIREQYPDAFDGWAKNPLKFSPMEGESTLDVKARALSAFNDIVGKHKGDTIAIVAHGGINRVILCDLLGIPLENIFRIEQDFAALNVIELWDYPVIRQMNYVV
jgi:alpha-ribazole phosphatase/probable phosphoglycerate mutase